MAWADSFLCCAHCLYNICSSSILCGTLLDTLLPCTSTSLYIVYHASARTCNIPYMLEHTLREQTFATHARTRRAFCTHSFHAAAHAAHLSLEFRSSIDWVHLFTIHIPPAILYIYACYLHFVGQDDRGIGLVLVVCPPFTYSLCLLCTIWFFCMRVAFHVFHLLQALYACNYLYHPLPHHSYLYLVTYAVHSGVVRGAFFCHLHMAGMVRSTLRRNITYARGIPLLPACHTPPPPAPTYLPPPPPATTPPASTCHPYLPYYPTLCVSVTCY